MISAHTNLPPLAVLGRTDDSSGSHLQGYCRTTYGLLVALLGEPSRLTGDKVNVHWAFRCAGGEVFTIYDWKEPAIPKGPYDWHIGGTSPCALAAFTRYTGLLARPLHPNGELRFPQVIAWDPATGQQLPLEHGVAINTDHLSPAELQILSGGSRSERIDLAIEKGTELSDLYLLTDDLS